MKPSLQKHDFQLYAVLIVSIAFVSSNGPDVYTYFIPSKDSYIVNEIIALSICFMLLWIMPTVYYSVLINTYIGNRELNDYNE